MTYVKPKYREKAKLCYMDTDSFIVFIKTEDIYKDIGEDVETRFDTSNYEFDRPLLERKNKKIIGLMKYELGCWINSRNFKSLSYLIGGKVKIENQKAQRNVS